MAQQQADAQAARNAAIVALAAQQVAQLWPQVDWASPDAVTAIKTIYGAIVARYGQASAAVAAQGYDELRSTKGFTSEFHAVPADPVPQAVIDKVVASAFLGNAPSVDHGNVTTVTTSDLPVEQRVPARLDDSLQRHVVQPARDTIAANVAADPAKPRYVRVPRGAKTCAFCVMLASRDSAMILGRHIDLTYRSAHSAQFVVGRGGKARGNQPIGEKYHDHCDCEPVAIFPGEHPSEVSPKFNDYQDMYYKATADAGTSRDTKKILASMRQLHGLR